MADVIDEANPAEQDDASQGRRGVLRSGAAVAGAAAVASVAIEMLRKPAPAFGAPRPRIDRPTCVAVSRPGKAVTCDDGKRVFLWELQADGTFRRTKFKKDHNRKMAYVDVAGGNVLAASFDGRVTVRRLDDPNAEPTLTFEGHVPTGPHVTVPEVWVVAGSADGSLALSGANDGTIHLWETRRGTIQNTFTDGHEWVAALAFLKPTQPGGPQKRFLSGHEDGRMVLWDVTNAASPTKRVFPHDNPMCPVNTVAVTDNGRFAVSAGFDGTARIWDLTLPDRAPERNVPLHTIELDDIVWRVAISPGNNKFAAACQNGTVRMFKIPDGTEFPGTPQSPQSVAANGGVMGVAFLSDTQVVYTTGEAGDGNDHVKVWDVPQTWP